MLSPSLFPGAGAGDPAREGRSFDPVRWHARRDSNPDLLANHVIVSLISLNVAGGRGCPAALRDLRRNGGRAHPELPQPLGLGEALPGTGLHDWLAP